jgi:hypothetical protein
MNVLVNGGRRTCARRADAKRTALAPLLRSGHKARSFLEGTHAGSAETLKDDITHALCAER